MNKIKFGVVVFPGSNCDHDAYYAAKKIMNQDAEFLWHKDLDLKGSDVIILPGGFSYGDYLRTGAIAQLSPIMEKVKEFAAAGGIVIGICNGFQVLCESGLLPGVLLQNDSLKFVCEDTRLKIENKNSIFTNKIEQEFLTIPIAHGDGNYFADDKTIEELEKNNQIVFRYQDSNPNGSIKDIAGIINKEGNVLGMMPHPERCADTIISNGDGSAIFNSVISNLLK
ncbi:MAG: phosphoribosylformylglycinamidine synthase subunit PurQ [Ignavibacteriaceae bacterium]|jgi:phosphoribosylformylglycinamidine synthase|nr:phosphoribosylformylglycinamidine synthase subunit PurQ [Ignavibacteriaceae bacterium]